MKVEHFSHALYIADNLSNECIDDAGMDSNNCTVESRHLSKIDADKKVEYKATYSHVVDGKTVTVELVYSFKESDEHPSNWTVAAARVLLGTAVRLDYDSIPVAPVRHGPMLA